MVLKCADMGARHCPCHCSEVNLLCLASPPVDVHSQNFAFGFPFVICLLPLVQIRPYVGCLVQYLPLLWKQSEEHNMLRCAILTTLIHVVQVRCTRLFLSFILLIKVQVFMSTSLRGNRCTWALCMETSYLTKQNLAGRVVEVSSFPSLLRCTSIH